MASQLEIREEFIKLGQQFVPEFKVISKDESWFHRAIGKVFPSYMTNFWTTIGFTTAHPSGNTEWEAIPHEIKHALQAKKFTRPLFYFLYLTWFTLIPIFSALGIFVDSWFFVGCVFSCFPFPSPLRTSFELEGYKMSIMVDVWLGEPNVSHRIDHLAGSVFKGPSYYFMWPLQEDIAKELEAAAYLAERWEESPYPKPEFEDAVFNKIKSLGLYWSKMV
jgi:hypothetical protein